MIDILFSFEIYQNTYNSFEKPQFTHEIILPVDRYVFQEVNTGAYKN
jgi:hypothetical protein